MKPQDSRQHLSKAQSLGAAVRSQGQLAELAKFPGKLGNGVGGAARKGEITGRAGPATGGHTRSTGAKCPQTLAMTVGQPIQCRDTPARYPCRTPHAYDIQHVHASHRVPSQVPEDDIGHMGGATPGDGAEASALWHYAGRICPVARTRDPPTRVCRSSPREWPSRSPRWWATSSPHGSAGLATTSSHHRQCGSAPPSC